MAGRSIPGEGLVYRLFDLVGETRPSMILTRQAARFAKGWRREQVRDGKQAAEMLAGAVQPFALPIIEDHRASGRLLVLATTTPDDMIRPLADRLGFDDVVATRYGLDGEGRYDGSIDGEFVWGRASSGRCGHGRATSTWPRATPTATRTTTTRCSGPSGTRWWSTRPPHAGAGHCPPVADRPPGRPRGRPKVPVIGIEPQRIVQSVVRPAAAVGAVRHRRRRQHPRGRAGHRRRQPPQLLRRAGPRRHLRQAGAGRALPRQEGGVRRPRGGLDRPGARRHPGRPGHRLRRSPGGGGRGPGQRRAGRHPPQGTIPGAGPSSSPS